MDYDLALLISVRRCQMVLEFFLGIFIAGAFQVLGHPKFAISMVILTLLGFLGDLIRNVRMAIDDVKEQHDPE